MISPIQSIREDCSHVIASKIAHADGYSMDNQASDCDQ